MGKILYNLSFCITTDNSDFNSMTITNYFNLMRWDNYILDIPFFLESQTGIEIPLIIKKEIYPSKDMGSNFLKLTCYYEIDTHDATSCGHITLVPVIHPIYKGHHMLVEFPNNAPYRVLSFHNGYKLSIGRNISEHLKIIHQNKLINIKNVKVLSSIIIDHKLNHWFC